MPPGLPLLFFLLGLHPWAGEGLSAFEARLVLSVFLDRTPTAASTGLGARPQGQTSHGLPIASVFGGSTLGEQGRRLHPPPFTEKEGAEKRTLSPAQRPPQAPPWAWTSSCEQPEPMPGPQGAGGAPAMNLGKLSPVGWVSSSQGKRRLTADMISPPLGDFRHTMHVGRGGDVFGDTSFLSNHGGSSRGTHRSPRSFLAKKLQLVRRVGAPPRRMASPPAPSPAPPAISPIIKNAISLPQLNQAAYDSLVVGKLSFDRSPAASTDGHSSYGEGLGYLPIFQRLRPGGFDGSGKTPSELFSPRHFSLRGGQAQTPNHGWSGWGGGGHRVGTCSLPKTLRL